MRKKYNYQNKNSKIKIIFKTNTGKKVGEHYFDIGTKMRDIFIYFENNYSNQGYYLKKEYKLFDKKIKPYNTLSDLLKDNVNNQEIYIEVMEKENLNNINNDNEEIYKKILFPKLNPFELVEYIPSENKLRYIKCPGQSFNFCSLYKFSKESAFCNSENELYMSGGLYNGKTLNHFWIVNKKDYQIIKKTMPTFKKYHSMLYIPDNFIFIVGGDSLSTFIYDIENKQFIRWANMNKKHFQPGILISGDYAYAFSAFADKNDDNNYFERTDLTSKNPKWEKIFPIFDIPDMKNELISLFFGVSKSAGDEILLLGGEKNNYRFRYNPIVNKMFLSEVKNSEISFWDKTFYNINNKYRIGIPMTFNKDRTLYLLNKKTEKLTKAICNPKFNKDYCDVIFEIDEDEQKENQEGILTIKNKDNDNEEVIEEEIIFIEELNDNKNEEPKIKRDKKRKEHLYLPFDVLDEQFINRELILNNIKENVLIINEIYDKEKDENKNINKKWHKTNYLYIPNSIIDEQIVNREIIPKIKNKKEDFKEQIIVVELNQKDKIEDNNNKNNFLIKKKKNIYIPNSALEEQIIQRELFKFKKKKNNIELVPKNDENIDLNNEIVEDKIILINYNNENENEKEEKNHSPQNLNHKSGILYMSPSSLDEQIILRKVNLDDIDNNQPKIIKKFYKININKVDNLNQNKNDILDENELINEFMDNNDINNNENNNKIIRKKVIMYIPKNIIEEQIINREIKEN